MQQYSAPITKWLIGQQSCKAVEQAPGVKTAEYWCFCFLSASSTGHNHETNVWFFNVQARIRATQIHYHCQVVESSGCVNVPQLVLLWKMACPELETVNKFLHHIWCLPYHSYTALTHIYRTASIENMVYHIYCIYSNSSWSAMYIFDTLPITVIRDLFTWVGSKTGLPQAVIKCLVQCRTGSCSPCSLKEQFFWAETKLIF